MRTNLQARACAVLMAGGLYAAQQPDVHRNRLQSSIDLVRVDVSVVDSKGRPVRGLTQDQFTVLEGGVPLRISAVLSVSDEAGGSQTELARPNRSRRLRNLFVVILDDLMLRVDNGALYRTKRVFREVISQLSGDDVAAVISTSGLQQHAVPFTSDKGALLRGSDGLMPQSRQPPPDISSSEPLSGSDEPSELWKARTSVATLKRVLQQLSTMDAYRKAVVLISEGVPYDLLSREGFNSEVRRELEASAEVGRNADIPVFAFDPGLVTAPPGFALQNLRLVADVTGGRVSLSSADLRTAVSSMMETQRTYYIVAFHPADGPPQSKHSFSVRVARGKVTARSRREYTTAASAK